MSCANVEKDEFADGWCQIHLDMVLCASLELQTRHLIAGATRMMYAIIYTLFLGYGITIGSVL